MVGHRLGGQEEPLADLRVGQPGRHPVEHGPLPLGQLGVLGLVAGAVAALAAGWEGAAIGLVVSLLIVALGFRADRPRTPTPAYHAG